MSQPFFKQNTHSQASMNFVLDAVKATGALETLEAIVKAVEDEAFQQLTKEQQRSFILNLIDTEIKSLKEFLKPRNIV